jgi:DNA (cytosine-5)-methyltransferase 1
MSDRLPRYKIGVNKGRRRIWIDGAKLANAGFTGGVVYDCIVRRGEIACVIPEPGDRAPTAPLPEGTTIRQRKVTGRPDGKPIIDLLGRDVDHAFPDGDHIKVKFEQGRITIRAGL